MRKRDVLDVEELKWKNSSSIYKAVDWWERWRLGYNIFVLGIVMTIVLVYTPNLKYFKYGELLLSFFGYMLAANICFCFGWGMEAFAIHLFERDNFNTNIRWILLMMGLVVTVGVSWFLYFI